MASIASLWAGGPGFLKGSCDEQGKRRALGAPRIPYFLSLRRKCSTASATTASCPWSAPLARQNPLYRDDEEEHVSYEMHAEEVHQDHQMEMGADENDVNRDLKMMKAPMLDRQQMLDTAHEEEGHIDGVRTPYGFGSLEDLRHIGDGVVETEEEASQEEGEIHGFDDLYPYEDGDAAEEEVVGKGAHASAWAGPKLDPQPEPFGPISLSQSNTHSVKSVPSKVGDKQEIIEEKYPNPPITVLHIHAGNMAYFLDAVPAVRQVVGLFVEMPLEHLSNTEWANFKQFFKHFLFDALSEIVFAFQGDNARILSLLLEVLPERIPLQRLALIESRVDGHNQAYFADLMGRAYQPFNLSFIYRGGRVTEVLRLMGGLTPWTQEKVKGVEWRADQTDPKAFRHLGSFLTSFNERTGKVAPASF